MTMPAKCCSIGHGSGPCKLADGRVICLPLYTELCRRLREEAHDQDFTPLHKLDRFVEAQIHHRYGKDCYLCEGEIVLHLQGAPLLRKLAPEDGKGTDAYFHTECWRIYQRDKANKKRRVRYADKETMEKQKELKKPEDLAAKNAGTSPMNTGNEPKSKRPRKDEEPTKIST